MYLKIFFKKTYFEEHLHTAAYDSRFGPNTKEISVTAKHSFETKKIDLLYLIFKILTADSERNQQPRDYLSKFLSFSDNYFEIDNI